MDTNIVLRVSSDDKRLIEAAAASKRLATSSWVRSVIISEALAIKQAAAAKTEAK